MTTAQYIVLKNDINSKLSTEIDGQTIAIHLANTNPQVIADYYNAPVSPRVDLWKPDVLVTDLAKSIVMSEFIALTLEKQNGYFVLTQGLFIDATNSNVRAAFVTIFGGGALTTTNLTAMAKKPATVFESLFTTSNISSVYNYIVSADDIVTALRS